MTMARLARAAATLRSLSACDPPRRAAHRQVGSIVAAKWSALPAGTEKTLIRIDADLIATSDVRRTVVAGYTNTTGSKEQ